MSLLSVIIFPTLDGAESAAWPLSEMHAREQVHVYDAAIISRGLDNEIRTGHLGIFRGHGSLEDSFWNEFFGTLFLPFFRTVGLREGGDSLLVELGIAESVIGEIRMKLSEGTSALVVLSDFGMAYRFSLMLKQRMTSFSIVSVLLPNDKGRSLADIFEGAASPSQTERPWVNTTAFHEFTSV